MIFDKENLFLDNVAATGLSSAVSAVVANGEGGSAVNPLWLYAGVKGGNTGGKLTVNLQTSDTEDFAAVTALATYDATAGAPIKAKLPLGLKKFLRLNLTSTFTAGTVTAGLVNDVDMQ